METLSTSDMPPKLTSLHGTTTQKAVIFGGNSTLSYQDAGAVHTCSLLGVLTILYIFISLTTEILFACEFLYPNLGLNTGYPFYSRRAVA
jgi:hypothetical protein